MVNIYELKLTPLQDKILRLMFINTGNSLNAHAISQFLKVSQAAISKALPLLEKKSLIIIKKDERSKRLAIELNRDDHRILWLKRADNLKQSYESGLVQFFYDNMPQATIILFGSYSTGEDTIQSDIDIAIIGRHKEVDLKKFENILERKINLNTYDSFGRIDKHLLNNILSGIVLKGTIEL